MENCIPGNLRWVGICAGVAAAIPILQQRIQGGLHPDNDLLLWCSLAIAFLALFWWLSRRPNQDESLAVPWFALGILSALSLVLIGFGGRAFGGVYSTLAVSVLGARIPQMSARVWTTFQSLALWPAFRMAGVTYANSTSLMFIFGGLSFFVLYTIRVAVSERVNRKELEATNRELRLTRVRLEEQARDAERLEIARELHDATGHHLAALSLTLEAAFHSPSSHTPEYVAEAQILTKSLLCETRKVVSALRSEPAEELIAGLERLAVAITNPCIHLELDLEREVRNPRYVHALLRCVQEIITNAIRHSDAKNVWVDLVNHRQRITLRARDDGSTVGSTTAGHGLAGMRERIRNLGGDLSWQSSDGCGFSIELWIPTSSESRA